MSLAPDASTTVDQLAESRTASARIAELRGRFPLLGRSVATRFQDAGGPHATHVRAVLPAEALRGVSRAARVALPLRANGEVNLADELSGLAVSFVLEHVNDTHAELAGGIVLYRGALDGADVVHRVHAEGTEDYVVFETRPAREELSYSVDVSRVPGLRLVSNTLEFLDDSGTPLLRVAPPYVVDARGQRREAKLAVSGCAYDASPVGPWGRPITRPGAGRCSVRVAWASDIAYPAMVDPGWSATGSMAAARYSHTASTLLSGKVLVVGSSTGGGALASAELFDPAGNGGVGTFAATGSLGTARFVHTATVLPSGKVLIAGGYTGSVILASAELYDPAGAGTFVATGSMINARSSHTMKLLASGKVLVAGGSNTGGALAAAEIFDPAGNGGAGAFVATGSMGGPRFNHTASVLPSGKVLIAGGRSPTIIASAELFDPAGNAGAGTFVATGSMITARNDFAASVLPSGKVLVAGGSNGTVLASAELFDPAGNGGAGSFSATGSLTAARYGHTASLLPSGKVLISGSVAALNVLTTELFDPAGNGGAGSFGVVGSMAARREVSATAVLPSARVLVTGGYDSGALASAEIFSLFDAGGACTKGIDCHSGLCADGVCCNTACGGGCDRCNLPGKEGTCTVEASGALGNVATTDAGVTTCTAPFACDGVNAACPTTCVSDAACRTTHFCAPSGLCEPRKEKGLACNLQTNCKQAGCRECASGFCSDGVCCDKACNGQCEACDSFAGVCGPIDGKPHGGRAACAPGEECSTSTNRCEAPAISTCADDHTAKGADGKTQDCAPYKCQVNGACGNKCSSVTDCLAPTICDPSGQCVPSGDDGGDGGCSIVSARREQGSSFVWLVAAAALLIRRRARTAKP